MSHIETVKSQINNKNYLIAACEQLGFSYKENFRGTLYDSTIVEGFAVYMPDLHYPVVIDTKTGAFQYDRWRPGKGYIDQSRLDHKLTSFKTEYNIQEKLDFAKKKYKGKKYSVDVDRQGEKAQIRVKVRA